MSAATMVRQPLPPHPPGPPHAPDTPTRPSPPRPAGHPTRASHLRNTWNLGLKEFRSLSRDLAMVFLIVFMFSASIYADARAKPESLNRASIAVVDEDRSQLSTRMVAALQPPQFITPEQVGLAGGQLGETLSVKGDVGTFQSSDKLRVGEAVRSNSGVDPNDPEAPHVRFPILASDKSVSQRLGYLLFRGPVENSLRTDITFGQL